MESYRSVDCSKLKEGLFDTETGYFVWDKTIASGQYEFKISAEFADVEMFSVIFDIKVDVTPFSIDFPKMNKPSFFRDKLQVQWNLNVIDEELWDLNVLKQKSEYEIRACLNQACTQACNSPKKEPIESKLITLDSKADRIDRTDVPYYFCLRINYGDRRSKWFTTAALTKDDLNPRPPEKYLTPSEDSFVGAKNYKAEWVPSSSKDLDFYRVNVHEP